MHGFGVALAAKLLNKPYVLSVDADFLYEHDFLGISHSNIERLIASLTAKLNYRAADAIICVSEATKNHLVSFYKISKEKIFVIPNSAFPQRFPSQHEIFEIKGKLNLINTTTIMFVGNFWPWHDIELLINSFEYVHTHKPQSRLVLIGAGITREIIVNIVNEKKLSDYVVFTGKVLHQQVPLYLGMADIVIAPYPKMDVEFWGSPMKIFEYMAAGKAIIATQAGQIGEILSNENNALLVTPGDVKEMSSSIIRLIEDPVLRNILGNNAYKQFLQKYTWENYIKKLTNVYEYVDRLSIEN